MEMRDVLSVIADGHSVLALETVQDVCRTLGILFPVDLSFTWNNQQEAWETYGFFPYEEGPGVGVNALSFSYYVAKQMGVGAPGHGFTGRGFQAQANSRAVAQKLGVSV